METLLLAALWELGGVALQYIGTLLLAALWELGGVALQCCVVFPEWTEINWCMYMSTPNN